MTRFFIKIANYPFDNPVAKRIEKEKERRRIEKIELGRLKTPQQRRDYLRYRSEGGFNKNDLDYKYGD